MLVFDEFHRTGGGRYFKSFLDLDESIKFVSILNFFLKKKDILDLAESREGLQNIFCLPGKKT